jgi:putative tryptophan/tyrosine transport system substrate-binding protein
MWPARRFPAMLLVALAISLLVALVAALAQPRAKPARIAVLELTPGPPASARSFVVAFQQHLRELGWVEGQNLTIEWRWAEGSLERFATLVEEMVRLPVDVMIVPNGTTAGVAQKATTTIPIIIVAGGALAQTVPNLAQPGGNVTGFAGLGPELWPKRLELLTQVIPGLTRVAVLRGARPPNAGVTGDGGRGPRVGGAAAAPAGARPHRDRPGVCRGDQRGCWRTGGV